MDDAARAKYERWGEIRTQGRDRFVWRRGVLIWGLATALLAALLTACMQGLEHMLFMLPANLIAFPIAGYFWGRWVWATAEQAYADYQKSTPA